MIIDFFLFNLLLFFGLIVGKLRYLWYLSIGEIGEDDQKKESYWLKHLHFNVIINKLY
jgi:hypothetical protein